VTIRDQFNLWTFKL